MGEQANPLEEYHSLTVVLPGGIEKSATVHGSKPVMDLLVTLCASYHLNPSEHTVEILSPNKNNISFKPSSLIGSLEAEKIVLKPKGTEEKIRKPYMPESSVRLLINYNKTHKAVVRVSPRVALESLLPIVCDKCEFPAETTVLLRDARSREPLDMSRSLNELGLREVFAADTAAKELPQPPTTTEAPVTAADVITPPPLKKQPQKKNKDKENTGFLSLFRRRKKNPEMQGTRSAQPSPRLRVAADTNAQGMSSSNTLPADMPKKRRAPQPPMGASHSLPNNLSTCHVGRPQSSAESTLRRIKRRAPLPPSVNGPQEPRADTEVKGTVDSHSALEELRESDESDSVSQQSVSPSSSTRPWQPRASPSPSSRPTFAHLQEVADPYLPSLRGIELSEARCALARVLTSSISKGKLVRRLRNSTTIPKLYSPSLMCGAHHKRSENEVFCEELESIRTADLPTEAEWEDPLERRGGMSTFKVVPLQTQRSNYLELTRDVSDQITVEGIPERRDPSFPDTRENHSEREEDFCSPDRSETEVSFQSPEPSAEESQASPSPSLHSDSDGRRGSELSEVEKLKEEDVDEEDESETTYDVIGWAPSDYSDGEPPSDRHIHSDEILQSPSRRSVSAECDQDGSFADGMEVEEETTPDKEKEDSFPPPPPPVFFNEDKEVTEEGREDTTASPLPSPSIAPSGQTNPSEPPRATPGQTTAAGPEALSSRFAEAVALAVQRSRVQGSRSAAGPQTPAVPPTVQAAHCPQQPGPSTSTVPECLPHPSLNGSPCLG